MNTYKNMNRKEKGLVLKGMLSLAALMVCSLSFYSCSDDLAEVTADDTDFSLTRGYTDEQIKIQRLGFAYNAAGNVMDDSSFTAKPIINMDKIAEAEKEYGPIVSSERRHYTSVDIFSGTTIQEMGHSETKYTIDDSEAIASGKYYRNNSTFSRTKWNSSYKAHVFIKHIMATKTIDLGMLYCLKVDDLSSNESVLQADFRKAVADLVKNGPSGINDANAKAFSEKWGTHLVASANLGGMIELQMEIKRDSCVDMVYTTQTVMEVVLGKNVAKTSKPKVLSTLPSHHIQYQGQIKVKGGDKKDCDALHRTFDETKAEAVKIGDGDYYGWANNITIEPDKYNASFVSGRFVPYYQLFEDYNTRMALRKVYELYLKQEAPTPEPYEAPYGVMPVQGNFGQDVRVAVMGNDTAAILCQEYVPSIRSDKPCIVAYPLIRDDKKVLRPYLYSGVFIGDESHRPGRVIWEGSASVYTPSDSIFFESDTASVSELFDPATHALKNVYFYWGAVQMQPCSTKEEAPKAYTSSVFSIQPAALAKPTNFAKVASTFWSVKPVELKTDNLLKYWDDEKTGDKDFKVFKKDRYKDHDGVLYDDGKYFFCLLDGGDNLQRAPEQTLDPYSNKRWTAAASMSMNALGLHGYLPSVLQSKSITKMLGNRMDVFYTREFGGRNILGLDWPTGFYVISHPRQTLAATPEKNDGQGMPIVTDDVQQIAIMRLSASGTDLLLEYPNYIRAFNYSDQEYFKFFPIYITIDKF